MAPKKKLRRCSENPGMIDDTGWTALHRAVNHGNVHAVKEMLTLTKNVDVKIFHKYTPLHIAVRERQLECFYLLLGARANVNVKDSAGKTPLHYAAENGEVIMLKELLKLCNDINEKDELHRTALHFAVTDGQMDCVDALLIARADVDAQDCYDMTPLHIAVMREYDRIIIKLLDLKADVNVQDSSQRTPLHIAVIKENSDYVDVLLRAGADMSTDLTPLILAVDCLNRSIWTKLFDVLQQWIPRNHLLFNLFISVLIPPKLEYFNDLLAAGASLDVRDSENCNLLHIAARSNIVLMILLEFNLDLNAQNDDGDTPLHIACLSLNFKSILLLLNAGARWDIPNKRGSTMLHVLITCSKFIPTEIDFVRLKEILEITNDGKVIHSYTRQTVSHVAFRRLQGNIEYIKLALATQKYMNVKDCCGVTVLDIVIDHFCDFQSKVGMSLIQKCIEHGAYLTTKNCNAIAKECDEILQDVELCTRSIANEFNCKILPGFYKNMNNDTFTVPMEALTIYPGSIVWNMIEEDVRSKIKRNGYCDVTCVVTTSLSKQCVESYCNAVQGSLSIRGVVKHKGH